MSGKNERPTRIYLPPNVDVDTFETIIADTRIHLGFQQPMTVNEYQKLAGRTLIDGPDRTYTQEELYYMSYGLLATVHFGNLIDHLKKGIFHSHGLDNEKIKNLSFRAFEELNYMYKMANGEVKLPTIKGIPVLTDFSDYEIMLIWNLFGLAGETGEVADLIRDAILMSTEVDRPLMLKEIGDVLWYAAAMASKSKMTFQEICVANIEKLRKRYKGEWNSEDSKHRADLNITDTGDIDRDFERDFNIDNIDDE